MKNVKKTIISMKPKMKVRKIKYKKHMKANTTINAMQPITTRQALHLIAKGHAAILVNILRLVHRFVMHYPYAVIIAILFVSIITSAYKIMQARAERDNANRRIVHLQQQVETLSCALEAGKENAK